MHSSCFVRAFGGEKRGLAGCYCTHLSIILLGPTSLKFPLQLGSFILLSALSLKCDLSASALKVIVGSMASCASAVETKQFLSAAIAVCEPQSELQALSGSTVKAILKLP